LAAKVEAIAQGVITFMNNVSARLKQYLISLVARGIKIHAMCYTQPANLLSRKKRGNDSELSGIGSAG
jgi:hypothetical protein